MKIERYFYGMFPKTGKIGELMTSNVRSLIGQKGIEYLKALRPEDSHRYIWFPQGVIAYPVIIDVQDEREGKGGRTWVQNQTLLMGIHDYIQATIDGVFTSHALPTLKDYPEEFKVITV